MVCRHEVGDFERCELLRYPEGVLDQEQVQRLSSAYQTLSDAQTRQQYDMYGKLVDGSEQTFADALSQVFSEFLAGHFDTLMRMVDYVQTQVFGSLREFVLWSGSCWDAAKFEVLRLYEIQHDLQCLSYLDVMGRWRTAGQLSAGMITLLCKLLSAKSLGQ
ncbi:hypothetical protein HK101_001864 [Irineochytrium annulatum]|nr:hypothetical protein HK101_001864 [Irineochytrium annulatum]